MMSKEVPFGHILAPGTLVVLAATGQTAVAEDASMAAFGRTAKERRHLLMYHTCPLFPFDFLSSTVEESVAHDQAEEAANTSV